MSFARVPEPEVMNDDAQARAYAQADFADVNQRFIQEFALRFPDWEPNGSVLDLGCGPGDISLGFARSNRGCEVHAVDASMAMLAFGEAALNSAPELIGRVEFMHGRIPNVTLPDKHYAAVISNSLLHHLPDPHVLWRTILTLAERGAPVFVMDLMRPDSVEEARSMVATYAPAAPDVLKKDFYNSLLAAYKPFEVRQQLDAIGFGGMKITVISDRHFIVAGQID